MRLLVIYKMVKSKTKIESQIKKKTDTSLVDTVIKAKKNEKWKPVAEILSGPRKNWINKNLFEINENAGDNNKIVVPGKVLSEGDVEKKLKVIAVKFSEKAKEKLLNSGCEISTIDEEIKSNPEGKDIEIIK